MSEFATADAPATVPPAAPDWPGRVHGVKSDLIAAGMHADYSAQGAWWLTLAEVMRAEDCDAYEAEVTLRGRGVLPPEQSGQRWTSVRGGDYMVPGTRGPMPTVQVHEAPPLKGRGPAEFMQKHRPTDLDRVLWVWRDCQGFMEVKPADVHEKVRAELGGDRAGEWSDEDINRALELLVHRELDDGRRFHAIGLRGFGRMAGAYQLRFPELSLRGPLKDPAFAPWLARITEHTLRLRDDPAFMPNEELPMRVSYADRQAYNEALAAYAAEVGELPWQARVRFERAGLGN